MRKVFETITPELLEVLKLHTTVSSIRRACAMCLTLVEQPATSKCPRLFYATSVENPSESDWEVHACECDICEYLMSAQAEGSDIVDSGRAHIQWDGVTGGKGVIATVVDRHDGETHQSMQCLQIGGIISYDEDKGENLIGFDLIFDPEVIEELGTPELLVDDQITMSGDSDYEVHGDIIISSPGQSHYLDVKWSDGVIEEFGIEVLQEAIVEMNEVSTLDELSWALSHSSRIKLTSDIEIPNGLEVSSSARVDIDLNSHTLTFLGDQGLVNNGQLTLRNGSLVGSDNTVTVVTNTKDSTLLIRSLEVYSSNLSSSTSSAIMNSGGNITIDGDTYVESSELCLHNSGDEATSDPNSFVTILSGEFVSKSTENYVISNHNNGLLDIQGGTFDGNGVIYTKSATTSLHSGTFRATGSYVLYMLDSDCTVDFDNCVMDAPEFRICIDTMDGDQKVNSTLNGVEYTDNQMIP